MRRLRARILAAVLLATAAGAGAVVVAGGGRVAVTEPGLLVTAVLFGVAVAVLAGELVARSVLAPVGELGRTADALAEGKHEVRSRLAPDDELGELAGKIDRMADEVEQRLDRMLDEEAQLRTILDAMVEGVFVTDREGRIVVTNEALVRLAGQNVEGRTPVEAIRSAELHDAVNAALHGVESSVQIEARGSATPRILAAHIAPLPGRSGVVAVLHDVTELKLADTVRRDFVANASHELRTPLTAIRGFAETLLDGAVSDPALAKRFLGRILEHSVRLSRLVDDLLELSRAESPDVNVELGPLDLEAAVGKAMRGLETAAAEKKLTLTTDGILSDLAVVADARALDHVLVNLVDNAVKYTPEGGTITVRARPDGDENVVLEVTDTGVGIAAAHLPRIFERFYRVDAGRSREVGGTGLGLAIVKHFVQRMGGDVGVESKLGKGTTFRVRLPRAQPADHGEAAA